LIDQGDRFIVESGKRLPSSIVKLTKGHWFMSILPNFLRSLLTSVFSFVAPLSYRWGMDQFVLNRLYSWSGRESIAEQILLLATFGSGNFRGLVVISDV